MCGAENPASHGYCNHCGAGLDAPIPAQPRPPPEPAAAFDGERKQVTVLFADVHGSMDLAEQTEPEDWREIMQHFFALLSESVRRFEGTVDKFTGDGIMALFGAPVAHEDHAARACFAALQIEEAVAEYATELRRSRGLSFSVRIGLNSGEVIAGGIGEQGELNYTAVGHTVGLAQRMEALAEPGKTYLTEHTARFAEGYLELRDLGEFDVKGASQPLGVFELVGQGAAHSRLDRSRARGLSRFVARAEEMAVLEAALEQAKQGRGGVIGVVADPGIGKSRLCHEFIERCRTEGIDVYEAQAQAHGEAIPFLPILQMMRSYFGIEDRDTDRVAREKIAGRLLLLDPGFADDLPLVFDFLAVSDPDRPAPQVSAEARERLLRGMIRRLYRVPDRDSVVVQVLEDLHWMDEASEKFVAETVSAVEGTATLVIVNFRPEYHPEWTDAPVYRRITLAPLGIDSTRELLADLAGGDPSIDGLAEMIHERTGGNPFFIEEVVRELAEAGSFQGERGAYRLARPIGDAKVPATVQAILAARIDRLAAAKTLLQSASVIGKEVPEPALRKVAELDDEELAEGLKELIAAGFLYEAEIYPERVLAFSHPLTQEVAYGSQLGAQRRATHAAVGHAMVELNPDRHDELAPVIAQHFERGAQPLDAARWYARAAHWAGYAHPREALRLWTKVHELTSEAPEDEETLALGIASRLLQLDYGWRLGLESARVDALISEARELATRTTDRRSLALLHFFETARAGLDLTAAEWTAAIDQSIVLADDSEDGDLRVAMRTAGAYAYYCAGGLERTEAMLDEALELMDGNRGAGARIVIGCPYAWALLCKASILRDRGEFEAAEAMMDDALRIAGEEGDPETESWTRGALSLLYGMRGDLDQSLAMASRNYELTERLGDVFSRSWALLYLGSAHLERQEFTEALSCVERADRVYRDAMDKGGETEGWREALMGEALVGLGRVDEGLAKAEHAVATLGERDLNWSMPRALRALAKARTAAGVPGATQALEAAERVGRECGLLVEADRARAEREAQAVGGSAAESAS